MDKKLIELYVLVDNNGRICYSGTYQDCYQINFNGMVPDLKIIKLEGVL